MRKKGSFILAEFVNSTVSGTVLDLEFPSTYKTFNGSDMDKTIDWIVSFVKLTKNTEDYEKNKNDIKRYLDNWAGGENMRNVFYNAMKNADPAVSHAISSYVDMIDMFDKNKNLLDTEYYIGSNVSYQTLGGKKDAESGEYTVDADKQEEFVQAYKEIKAIQPNDPFVFVKNGKDLLLKNTEELSNIPNIGEEKKKFILEIGKFVAAISEPNPNRFDVENKLTQLIEFDDDKFFKDSYQYDEKTESDVLKADRTVVQIKNVLRNMETGLKEFGVSNSQLQNTKAMLCEMVDNTEISKNPLITREDFENVKALVNVKNNNSLDIAKENEASVTEEAEKFVKERLKNNIVGQKSGNKEEIAFMNQIRKASLVLSKEYKVFSSEEEAKAYDSKKERMMSLFAFFREDNNLIDMEGIETNPANDLRLENINHLNNIVYRKNSIYQNNPISDILDRYPGGRETAIDVLCKAGLGCKNRNGSLLSNILVYAKMLNKDKSFEEITKDSKLIEETTYKFIDFAKENRLFEDSFGKIPLGDVSSRYSKLKNLSDYYKFAYHCFDDEVIGDLSNHEENIKNFDRYELMNLIGIDINQDEQDIRNSSVESEYLAHFDDYKKDGSVFDHYIDVLAVGTKEIIGGEFEGISSASRAVLDYVAPLLNGKKVSEIDNPLLSTEGFRAFYAMLNPNLVKYAQSHGIPYQKLIDFGNGGENPFPKDEYDKMVNEAAKVAVEVAFDTHKSNSNMYANWYEQHVNEENAKKAEQERQAEKVKSNAGIEEIKNACLNAPIDNSLFSDVDRKAYSDLLMSDGLHMTQLFRDTLSAVSGVYEIIDNKDLPSDAFYSQKASLTSTINKYVEARKDSKYAEVKNRVQYFKDILTNLNKYENKLLREDAFKYDTEVKSGEFKANPPQKVKDIAALGNMMLIAGGVTLEELRVMNSNDERMINAYSNAVIMLSGDMRSDLVKKIANGFETNIVKDINNNMNLVDKNGKPLNEEAKKFLEFSDRFLKTTGAFAEETMSSLSLSASGLSALPRSMDERAYKKKQNYILSSVFDEHAKNTVRKSSETIFSQDELKAVKNAGLTITTRKPSVMSNVFAFKLIQNPQITPKEVVDHVENYSDALNEYIQFEKENPVFENYSLSVPLLDENKRKESLKNQADFYKKWYEYNNSFTLGNVKDPAYIRENMNVFAFMSGSLINCSQNEGSLIHYMGEEYFAAFGGRKLHGELVDSNRQYINVVKNLALINDSNAEMHFRAAAKMYIDLVADDISNKKVTELKGEYLNPFFSTNYVTAVAQELSGADAAKLRDYVENGTPFLDEKEMSELKKSVLENTRAITSAAIAGEKASDEKATVTSIAKASKKKCELNEEKAHGEAVLIFEEHKRLEDGMQKFMEVMYSDISYQNPATGKEEIIGRRKQDKDEFGKLIKDNSISVESVFEKLVDKPLHEIVRPGAGEYMALGYALTKGLTMDEFNTFIDGRDKEQVAEITKKIKSCSQPFLDMVVNQKTDEMVQFFVDYSKSMKNCDEALKNCTSLSGMGKNFRNIYHLAGAHSILCQTLNIGTNNQNAEQKAMVDKINHELGKEGMDLDSFSLYRMLGHSIFQFVNEGKPGKRAANANTEERKKAELLKLSGALSCARMFAKISEETIENGRLSAYGEMGPSAYFFRMCLTQRENTANNKTPDYQNLVNEIYSDEDTLLFSDVLLDKSGKAFEMDDLLKNDQTIVNKMTDSEFIKGLSDKDVKGVRYSKYEAMRYLNKETTLVPADLQPTVEKIRRGEDYSGFATLPVTIKKALTTEYVYKNSLVLSGNKANFVEVMARKSLEKGRNEFANPMLSYVEECGFPDHVVANTEMAGLYKDYSPETIKEECEKHPSALYFLELAEKKVGGELLNNIFERKTVDGKIEFVPVFDKEKDYTREESARIVGEKFKQNGEILVFENESSFFTKYFGTFVPHMDQNPIVPTKEQIFELGDNGFFMSRGTDDLVISEAEQASIDSFAALSDEEKIYFVKECLRNGIPVRENEQEFIEANLEKVLDYNNKQAVEAFRNSGSMEDFNKLDNISKNYVASFEYSKLRAYSEHMRDFDSETIWETYLHFEHCAENPAVQHMKTNLIENEATRKDINVRLDKHREDISKCKPDEKAFFGNIELVCQNKQKFDNLNQRLADIFLNGEPAVYFTNPVTNEKIFYHNEKEYSKLGKQYVSGHPFSEAFDRNMACHMRFFAMTSGVPVNDLLMLMNEPESQKALEVTEKLKGLKQGYADFISGINQEDIANRYINYIETFNKEDDLVKNLDSFDKIAKQSDKLLLFADTHSILGQTLKYDKCSTDNSYELIKNIQGKLAQKNTDFEHGTAMLYATGSYVSNKLFLIGHSTEYIDIKANNNSLVDRALHSTALGEYISKVAKVNNLSLEESGKLPNVVPIGAAIDGNMSPSSIDDLGVESEILESNAYDYILGRKNAVGFVRENIPILESVAKGPGSDKYKSIRAALVLDEINKEKNPEKKNQLTKRRQEIIDKGDDLFRTINTEFEDRVVDYREYDALFRDDKNEVRDYLDSKLASKGIPNKYMVARFFNGEPSIRTAEEDNLLNEYRRNPSDAGFKNLGEHLQKLECSRFLEENNGYFLSTDDKLVDFLNESAQNHGMKVQMLMELGCEDPAFGKRFREIDGRTNGKFTFGKALRDLQELSEGQKTSELFNKAFLHLETMVESFETDPTYQPTPDEYNALSKLCNDYIDKHYDDSKSSIGGMRRDVVNRVRDCCQNALSYSKVDGMVAINGEDRVVETGYTPIISFKDEMDRIKGGIFNSGEFISMAQTLDMIFNTYPDGLVIENEKSAYVEALSKLSSEAGKYLEEKGSDQRSTDKGQKRYDLAKKMKDYADNFIDKYDNEIFDKYSKSFRGNGPVPENVSKESRAIFVMAHAVATLQEKGHSQYLMGLMSSTDIKDSVNCAKKLFEDYKKSGDAKEIKGLFGLYKENIHDRIKNIMTYEKTPKEAFGDSSHQKEIYEYLRKCGNEISIFENEYPQFLNPNQNYDMLPKTYEDVLDVRQKNEAMLFKVLENNIREKVDTSILDDKKVKSKDDSFVSQKKMEKKVPSLDKGMDKF